MKKFQLRKMFIQITKRVYSEIFSCLETLLAGIQRSPKNPLYVAACSGDRRKLASFDPREERGMVEKSLTRSLRVCVSGRFQQTEQETRTRLVFGGWNGVSGPAWLRAGARKRRQEKRKEGDVECFKGWGRERWWKSLKRENEAAVSVQPPTAP